MKNDRMNLEPESLQDLQVCLYDWQTHNFGEQDNELTLLGICEESGELCHAQLKREQNIRGTAKEHDQEMLDAIGDVMIYTMNFLSGNGKKIPSFTARTDVEKASEENQKVVRRAILTVYRLAAKIVEKPDDEGRSRQLVHQLVYLCALKGWDLERVIRVTWGVVGQRDFQEYPDTGMPPVEPAVQAAG